jgi:hypothetical protein
MSISYESVVPWGRSYQEYVDMFGLSEFDLNKTILGCADGPASFNCIMNKTGKKVISIDPIYQFSSAQIEKRIEETYLDVISQTRQNQEKFLWTKIKNVEDLGNIRMLAMKEFLSDYETGKKENRYIYAELPILPFKDKEFELVVSSHFLFLYTDNLSLEFHIQSIKEMLRVANEVRIFPVIDVNALESKYLKHIMKIFSNQNFQVDLLKVGYEFQKGGNQMLRIK